MFRSKSDIKCVYIIFIKFCCGIILTDSRSSTIWKLNSDETKIIEGKPLQNIYKRTNESNQQIEDDLIFNIISSTVHFGESWIKGDIGYVCTNCHNLPNNVVFHK